MSEPMKIGTNTITPNARLTVPLEDFKTKITSTEPTTPEATEKPVEAPTAPVKAVKMLRTARKSTSFPNKTTNSTVKKNTVKKAVKNVGQKVKPNHPPFIEMIKEAIEKLNERTGSSRQAILKYIVSNFEVQEKSGNQHVKVVLKNAVKAGSLKQVKGVGASGSFKLSDSLKSKAKTKEKLEKKTARKLSTPVKKLTAKKCISTVAIKGISSRLASFSTAGTKPIAKKIVARKKVAKKISKIMPAAAKKPITKQAAKSKTKTGMAQKNKKKPATVKSKKTVSKARK